MTAEKPLQNALFDVQLSANAPVRLVSPPTKKDETWWKLGDGNWVKSISHRIVLIENPESGEVVEATFKKKTAGIKLQKNVVWAKSSDEVQELASFLLGELSEAIKRAMSRVPMRARIRKSSENWLQWQNHTSKTFEGRRSCRAAHSLALAKYFSRDAEKIDFGKPEVGNGLDAQLLRHLSAIPRPSDVHLRLFLNDDGIHELSWKQNGTPELIWGAADISWNNERLGAEVTSRPLEEMENKLRGGAFKHLLAMATAVEAATGGIPVPVRLAYRSDCDQPVSAALTIAPDQWGFLLPSWVKMSEGGHTPEEFLFEQIA